MWRHEAEPQGSNSSASGCQDSDVARGSHPLPLLAMDTGLVSYFPYLLQKEPTPPYLPLRSPRHRVPHKRRTEQAHVPISLPPFLVEPRSVKARASRVHGRAPIVRRRLGKPF